MTHLLNDSIDVSRAVVLPVILFMSFSLFLFSQRFLFRTIHVRRSLEFALFVVFIFRVMYCKHSQINAVVEAWYRVWKRFSYAGSLQVRCTWVIDRSQHALSRSAKNRSSSGIRDRLAQSSSRTKTQVRVEKVDSITDNRSGRASL